LNGSYGSKFAALCLKEILKTFEFIINVKSLIGGMMDNLIKQKQWKWLTGGIALGVVFLIAVVFVKPIGVSTQFVIFDGIIWNFFKDLVVKDSTTGSYLSSNPYIHKYVNNIMNPINYSFIFVLSMIVGGYFANKFQNKEKGKEDMVSPKVWKDKFGDSNKKRYLASFFSGIFVLFGARLAGGCTSGHMMSGMMQTSLSGYLFTLGTFIVAVPVAIFLYKKEGE
jgi:hypothetical protein